MPVGDGAEFLSIAPGAIGKRRGGPLASAGYRSWHFGFVSGVNDMTSLGSSKPDLLKGRDGDGLVAWIDNYRAAHPPETLADASIRFAARLFPRFVV